jgi:hypothetical protein
MKIPSFLLCLSLSLRRFSGFFVQHETYCDTGSRSRHGLTRCFAIQHRQHDGTSRRDLLTQATGLALSFFLLGQTSILPAYATDIDEKEQLTFVMTGANSGIGFEACKRLSALGHRIVLACRTKEKAVDAMQRLGGGSNLVAAECNLASLASIAAFCNDLPSLLGEGKKIDRLCLNAGLCRNIDAKDCVRTADGFELTGKPSHLDAPQLLGFSYSVANALLYY